MPLSIEAPILPTSPDRAHQGCTRFGQTRTLALPIAFAVAPSLCCSAAEGAERSGAGEGPARRYRVRAPSRRLQGTIDAALELAVEAHGGMVGEGQDLR